MHGTHNVRLILQNIFDIKSRKMRLVETCSIFVCEEKRLQGFNEKFKEIDFLMPRM